MGGGDMIPDLRLAECERTEKERIIQAEVYTLTIALTVPEPEAERNAYAYAAAFVQALGEDPALGWIAGRAELIKKVYTPPKHPYAGGSWETVFTVYVTIERMGRAA
jgi:hypothetical protein